MDSLPRPPRDALAALRRGPRLASRRLGSGARLAALGLLVAACSATGAAGASPTSGAIAHPSGPDELVLRIETVGGSVAPAALLDRLPDASLYGDGRLLTPGAQIAIYPPPALPSVQVIRLDEAAVQRILARAAAAGLLGPDRRLDRPGIADAPTTVVTVVAGGSRHVTSAYALGVGGTGDESAERVALAAFRDALLDPRALADPAPPTEQLPIERLQVVASPAAVQGSTPEAPSAPLAGRQPWPLPASLASFGVPLAAGPDARCGVLSGADLALALPALRTSSQATTWLSGGRDWRLLVRPLLPDEAGCTLPAG